MPVRQYMIQPPTLIGRCSALPKASAAPKELDALQLTTADGRRVKVSLLRWETADFSIESTEPSNGWFLTIAMQFNEITHHLHQYRSIFFTNINTCDLRPVSSSSVKAKGHPKPDWKRKSDRWWPAMHGQPLPFLGQFVACGHVCYLFSSDINNLVAAYVDVLDVQDVEDHYDEEVRRNA